MMWILMIFIVYYLSTVGMNAVAQKGYLTPILSMWIPNIAGVLIGGAFLGTAARR